ncbi:hypothetical protein AJ79_08944 [Helicocarpus griseus UAMH5409]|uniref:Uncharacterized protein n=1 Tax=Helicocarpus griseus UAMH5409 TaxID=1447875 RepID=A0A2B7WNA2_9EURO|nr:hypothetical protein AJ79_08944 [Helicocarpus griseus UAMH5409]
MPSKNRSAGRNVFFVLDPNLDKIRGGLCAGPIYSEADFLSMLSIVIKAPEDGSFNVYHKSSDEQVLPTDNILEHGTYVIRPLRIGAALEITEERCYTRTVSLQSSAEEDQFRDPVRERDKMCVVTGTICYGAMINQWTGFEAAHIIPPGLEDVFLQQGLSTGVLEDGVHSPKNGLLLGTDLQKQFDQYHFAINPFNSGRAQKNWPFLAQCTQLTSIQLQSKYSRLRRLTLQAVCRDENNPHCISVPLLWWHFKQAVLANMRGAGEPIFEDDFPPGTDQMGEILQGPMAKERMEFELANRLHSFNNGS